MGGIGAESQLDTMLLEQSSHIAHHQSFSIFLHSTMKLERDFMTGEIRRLPRLLKLRVVGAAFLDRFFPSNVAKSFAIV